MKEPTFRCGQDGTPKPLSHAPLWLLHGAASGIVPFLGGDPDQRDESFTRMYAAILLRERT